MTTYQQEIDALLNPDLLRVDNAGGATQSLDRLVEAAVATLPGFEATGVRLPQSGGESVEVSLSSPAAGVFAGWYAYVDPRDARVLGARPFDPDPWSRRGVVASLYEFHYSLAASRTGVWTVTIAAGLWIFTSLLGAWLAWPRSMHGWRRAFRVRFAGGYTRVNGDLHKCAGLLATAFLVVVLASGILLNFAAPTAAAVRLFSPVTSEPALSGRAMARPGAAIGWHRAVEAARRAQPGAAPYAVYNDAARRLYVVRMREADAIHRRGQTRVYVDARDAAVLAVWNPRLGSAGDRFMSWQNPLHSGHAFGGAGRVIVFLCGLAAVLLVVTGVPRWFAQRPARLRR